MQWATEAAKYGVMAQSGECIACIVVVLFWWGGGEGYGLEGKGVFAIGICLSWKSSESF